MDTLEVTHIQVNQAQQQRRRTYRAHGRINREGSFTPLTLSDAQATLAFMPGLRKEALSGVSSIAFTLCKTRTPVSHDTSW